MVIRPLAITVLGLSVLWAAHSGLRAMQARQQARRCEEGLRHMAWRFEVRRQQLASERPAPQPVAATTVLAGQGPPALGGAVVGSATIGVPIPEASPQATRRFLISRLRQTATNEKVRVEELRIGSTLPEGGTRVRPVTLRLAGRRDALKRVLDTLKADPVVRSLRVAHSEGKGSQVKVTLDGRILAALPGPP